MPSTSASTETSSSRYAWAEHLISMEGGEPVETDEPRSPWPGVILCVALAAAAFGLSALMLRAGWTRAKLLDPILLSMLLGLVCGNALGGDRFYPGLSVAVRKLLPLGIVLLGARMDFFDALGVGAPGLVLSAAVVLVALGFFLGLRRWLGLERDFATLLGVGTGICGGTAIVAIAPLVSARERDVMAGVGLVTLVGFGAMLVLPVLGDWLELSQSQFGLLAGLTIHQTPQVIASGFAYGGEAGEVATVAKLARVCLLAPVAVVFGWLAARSGATLTAKRKPWYRFLPAFAVGFLLMAAARTLGLFPEMGLTWDRFAEGADDDLVRVETATLCKQVSGFLLATGMVGVGFQTRISQLREIGWRPLLVAAGASILIGVLVLAVVKLWLS